MGRGFVRMYVRMHVCMYVCMYAGDYVDTCKHRELSLEINIQKPTRPDEVMKSISSRCPTANPLQNPFAGLHWHNALIVSARSNIANG